MLHFCDGSINAATYIDVLRTVAVPHLRQWFPRRQGIFMQDNAPAHTAKVVKDFLDRERVSVLTWPANSPDLNPIENIWGLMKRKLQQQTVMKKEQLREALNDIWLRDDSLRQAISSAIDSMPRRIEAVIAAKGGVTKY